MKVIVLILCLILCNFAFSQTFLDSYKSFKAKEISKNNKTKKQRIASLNHRIYLFDSVFKAYKEKTGFDFDKSDSLVLIYQTEVESGLSYYLTISGKDTISFKEDWITTAPLKGYITFVNHPFFDTSGKLNEHRQITAADSLVSLSKLECSKAQVIAAKNPVNDGATATILHAKRNRKGYLISQCRLGSFGIFPFYRKE